MIKSLFSELGFIVSKKQLDTTALRQKVIADNIANINTPGFKRSDVNFEATLEKAINGSNGMDMKATSKKHFKTGTGTAFVSDMMPVVQTDMSSSMRADENNVDMDKEMVGLAKNQITYETFTRILAAKFRSLTSVISEGRR